MAQPTSFQRQLEQLGENTRRAVMGTYRSMTAAGLDTAAAIEVLTPVLQRGAMESEAMARAELARVLDRMGLADTMDTGAVSFTDADPDRTRQALTTALDDDEHALMRLERLARSAPMEAAQRELTTAMQATRGIVAYVRVLESDACELCQWLYRDGFMYPIERPLTTHPGCLCTARPVTGGEYAEWAGRRYGGDSGAAGGQSDSARRRSARLRAAAYERAGIEV